MSALTLTLALHACLLLVMGVTCLAHVLSFGGPLWVVAVVVPVAGPVSALALAVAVRMPGAGQRAEALGLLDGDGADDDALVNDDMDAVVPLEDAMLVSDASQRRSLVMDVLLRGEQGLGRSLALARASKDQEVAHYASSASMEMSAALDEQLASALARYQAAPDDLAAVDSYVDVIERYLGSGVAEGEMRGSLEARLREVLAHRAELSPTERNLVELASSQLDAGLLDAADGTLGRLEEGWPGSDDAWLLRLRYWYQRRDPSELRSLLGERDRRSASARVRQKLDFWERVMS